MYNDVIKLFDENVDTRYIENITGQHPNKMFSMFKSETLHDGVLYSCERICINRVNGLICKRSDETTARIVGLDIKAEDPRLIICNEKVYIVFNRSRSNTLFPRCMALSEFDNWSPITLEIKTTSEENHYKTEKNWSPFVKNGTLYFVYNLEPLIVLTYDFNVKGECTIIHPLDIDKDPSYYVDGTYIRGGSNLIPYQGDYYIGAFHSRLLHKYITVYYTHIVILDTKDLEFKVVYLSKPIALRHEKPDTFIAQGPYDHNERYQLRYLREILLPFGRIPINTNSCSILSPCSIYKANETLYMTVNVQDSITLRYELRVNNAVLEEPQKDIPKNLNDFTKQSLENIISIFPIKTNRKKTKVCYFA